LNSNPDDLRDNPYAYVSTCTWNWLSQVFQSLYC
jgi:hypothetical protein